jgi:hypothetical protein
MRAKKMRRSVQCHKGSGSVPGTLFWWEALDPSLLCECASDEPAIFQSRRYLVLLGARRLAAFFSMVVCDHRVHSTVLALVMMGHFVPSIFKSSPTSRRN